jgi:LmbE family N-acetylglucosaminyl deacetylase
MKRLFFIFLFFAQCVAGKAQQSPAVPSSEIAMALKKLEVLGSVLYVAAHPDDENTRLIAYLSREKMYRTGYLSITRGDGGQNLIGDEQGIELGLIRTQELLGARRIDGGEQFFTRAYDFGFSKSTEEALQIWGREKILADAVWVIRQFRPDVIITRFPEDGRAGHGHHSASAVLAREAFTAAADSNRFPEHFRQGALPWRAKRIMWNTFNFGGANTTNEAQFKIDVGGYLPLMGKSLGELAAESRSQHKSQGFGVPSSRGASNEYFVPILGDAPVKDLMDGVNTSWDKLEGAQGISKAIRQINQEYDFRNPSASLPALCRLYQDMSMLAESNWKTQKMRELAAIIEQSAGLYLEASVSQPYAVQGDSLRMNIQVINRSSARIRLLKVAYEYADTMLQRDLLPNQLLSFRKTLAVPESKANSQPYWLQEEMEKGAFTVQEQKLTGRPENPPSYSVRFTVEAEGVPIRFEKPVWYKFTDPVKGERFQPVYVVPPVSVNTSPGVVLFRKGKSETRNIQLTATAFTEIPNSEYRIDYRFGKSALHVADTGFHLGRGLSRIFSLPVSSRNFNGTDREKLTASLQYVNPRFNQANYLAMATVNYDHIPSIRYFYPDGVTLLNLDIQTAGKKLGYIRGAGDKVAEALEEMGYEVSFLEEADMELVRLRQFDAIVTGIRAYNVHEWLNTHHDDLMAYVENGGNLVVQYNTNSFVGPVKARIGPRPFNISRNRITDENSPVRFLEAGDKLLNWPNKISQADFEGWAQERGVYFAETPAEGYRSILAMQDPGEKDALNGSLVVASHGKGRFIYTGLAFFRQLPAAVPGAWRLFANLVSNPNQKINGTGR